MNTKLEKKYSTGVLWQDFQHTKLINLLGKLTKSRSDGNGSDAFDYAVAFLAMYVNDHFDLEENYMKEYNYPDIEQHVLEHKGFIKQIRELRHEHSKHSDEAMDILVHNITEWIKKHIMQNDMRLGAFISSIEKVDTASESLKKKKSNKYE